MEKTVFFFLSFAVLDKNGIDTLSRARVSKFTPLP